MNSVCASSAHLKLSQAQVELELMKSFKAQVGYFQTKTKSRFFAMGYPGHVWVGGSFRIHIHVELGGSFA